MKKRVVSLILLAASALTVTLCAVLQAQSQRMADKIIRLHVVANSDTSADQAVKLAVRDAVLREAGRVLDGTGRRIRSRPSRRSCPRWRPRRTRSCSGRGAKTWPA